MRQQKIKRVRRVIRALRKERLEREEQSARVGVDMGWRWAIFNACAPMIQWIMPATWVCWLANRALAHARWRLDRGDWRPFDPPRYFTPADLGDR